MDWLIVGGAVGTGAALSAGTVAALSDDVGAALSEGAEDDTAFSGGEAEDARPKRRLSTAASTFSLVPCPLAIWKAASQLGGLPQDRPPRHPRREAE